MHESRHATPVHALSPGFWARFAGRRERRLVLDYDGTLAPFRRDRHDALPPDATMAVLRRLARHRASELCVVSGRPVFELQRLLRGLPIPMVGEHGWESSGPDGSRERRPLPPETAARLERAWQAAYARDLSRQVERKRTALVAHARGLPAPMAQRVVHACAEAWAAFADDGVLSLEAIDGGLELRASARDKGMVLTELRRAAPADALIVFVGDDVGDEPAFRQVRESGLGVRVGRSARATAAHACLADADEVTAFLARWESLEPAADVHSARAPGAWTADGPR